MPLQQKKTGQIIRPRDWNQLTATLNTAGRLAVVPPLELINAGTGPTLRVNPDGFWARVWSKSNSSSVTDSSSTDYEWEEVVGVVDDAGLHWYDTGLAGDKAFEINGFAVTSDRFCVSQVETDSGVVPLCQLMVDPLEIVADIRHLLDGRISLL